MALYPRERNRGSRNLQQRDPHVPSADAYYPFTVVTVGGNRHEVDHPEAIVEREGMAIYIAPGRVPVIFDSEGVSEIIGDLAGRGAEI